MKTNDPIALRKGYSVSSRFPLISVSPPLSDQIVQLLAAAPATRGELCTALQVSRSVLGRALIDLLDKGFIEQVATKARPQRGKPVGVLSLRDDMAYAIGLDIERSRSTAIVVDRAGRTLIELEHVYSGWDWARICHDLCSRLRLKMSMSGINSESVAVLGVGVPFPVRRIVFGAHPVSERNSRFYNDELLRELQAIFSSFWDVPTLFDNTVCMSGLSEAARCADGACRHLYVRVSGGVGGCFVHSDDVGLAHVLACELGHVEAGLDARSVERCHCGQLGCVETLVRIESLCRRCDEVDFDGVVRRFYDRDPDVVGVVNDAAIALGRALATTITLFAPETITIGGEVPSRIREFTELVRLEAYSRLMPELLSEITVEEADSEPLLSARGAVWAAFGFLSQVPSGER